MKIEKTYRIIAIFSKKINEEKYNEVCYYNKSTIIDSKILQKNNIDIIHK